MPNILITGAGGSAAANFIDALHQSKAQHNTVGVDVVPYHLVMFPSSHKYIVPKVSDPGYIDSLNRIIDRHEIDLVHPQPDGEVAFLATNRDLIRTKLLLPDTESIELCHDKLRFNQVLGNRDVPVPKAYGIFDKVSLAEAIHELLAINSRAWLRAIRGAGSRASLPVNSLYQADAWIDYWRGFRGLDYGDFMISELLPGKEFAWQSIWYKGELLTCQARERIEYIFGNLTPSGQSSSPSVARTVNRDDINIIGQAAVQAVSEVPHGVFSVDMKEDGKGCPRVTEINPGRFFTTSNFFAHAGLNMPEMYVELAIGRLPKQLPPKVNPLPEDLYWVRMIDMGYKLITGDKWLIDKI